MAIFHDSAIVGASGNQGGGGYEIERSLRFNSSDSAYLSRTFSATGNRKKWTWAGWVKRSLLSRQSIFHGSNSGSNLGNGHVFELSSSNYIEFYSYGGVSPGFSCYSAEIFRDPSAWYHLVVVLDTTLATDVDRIKIYVNSNRLTLSGTFPTQTSDLWINAATWHNLGSRGSASLPFDGYLADVHFIDNQALDPTSFGEFDTNGMWQPIEYTGTYGTNGFHLPFSDNSTAAALGTDTSGNSNTWTVNNISVAAGAGNDSLVDTPTNYGTDTGAGGEVRGNYCTWNPLYTNTAFGTGTYVDGNLQANVVNGGSVTSTIAVSSGKWYAEVFTTSNPQYVGIREVGTTDRFSQTIYYEQSGAKVINGSTTPYGTSWTLNDVIGIALDLDGGTVVFYKNGVAQPSIALSSASITTAVIAAGGGGGAASGVVANFGQRPFAYTAPSGFKALCTTNLPAPVVAKPSTAMDVKLYTGNGGTQTISGLGFSPDVVWLKSRSGAFNHALFDTVRSAGYQINPNLTDAETLDTTKLSAFTSDGFTLGSQSGVNGSGSTFVAWTWDAGTSTVTNTQGSITSQVRANASAGFSVVSFTGAGGSQTVGHGLGVTPAMIIAKNRATTNSWAVWFTGFTANEYLVLNSTGAKASFSPQWGSTPTSTVFGVADSSVNGSGNGIIAYCFAPVAGYSSFGSYTGNGNNDGPFVYTGFRPRWVMIKRTDTADHWVLQDTARDPYNIASQYLLANLSNAEGTSAIMDITSNGFKQRNTFASNNASGGTYVWAAFAESPFQYARAR